MKRNYPYLISCDWLQLYCQFNLPPMDVLGGSIVFPKLNLSPWESNSISTTLAERGYRGKDRGFGSKVFREVYELTEIETEEPIATIAFDPYSTIGMPQNAAILKIENKVLYEPNLWERVGALMDALCLRYVGITRLDICYDCNLLANGRNPQNLCNDFDAGKIRRSGSRDYLAYKTQSAYIKSKETKNNLHPSYDVADCKGGWNKENRVKSLTWGLRGRSALQCQIYDKTDEIKAGAAQKPGYKQHIVNCWKEAGIDIEKKVWRFECRITADAKDLYDINSQKYFRLGLDDLANQEQLERVFAVYANKGFSFFEFDPTKDRLSRMPKIDLFCCLMDVQVRTKHTPKNPGHSRTYKILTKYLENMAVSIPHDAEPSLLRKKAVYHIAAQILNYDRLQAEGEEFKNYWRDSSDKIDKGTLEYLVSGGLIDYETGEVVDKEIETFASAMSSEEYIPILSVEVEANRQTELDRGGALATSPVVPAETAQLAREVSEFKRTERKLHDIWIRNYEYLQAHGFEDPGELLSRMIGEENKKGAYAPDDLPF